MNKINREQYNILKEQDRLLFIAKCTAVSACIVLALSVALLIKVVLEFNLK